MQGDLRSMEDVSKAVNGADCVWHVAPQEPRIAMFLLAVVGCCGNHSEFFVVS